jgi:hypothetical protein
VGAHGSQRVIGGARTCSAQSATRSVGSGHDCSRRGVALCEPWARTAHHENVDVRLGYARGHALRIRTQLVGLARSCAKVGTARFSGCEDVISRAEQGTISTAGNDQHSMEAEPCVIATGWERNVVRGRGRAPPYMFHSVALTPAARTNASAVDVKSFSPDETTWRRERSG